MYKLTSAAALLAALAACGSDPSPATDAGPVEEPICPDVRGNVTADGLEIRRPVRDPVACREIPVPGATEGETQCEQRVADFSCLGQTSTRTAPVLVTMRACVETFGINAPSNGLTVTVLPEKKADGSPADPGYDLSGVPGMQADRTPPIGKVLSVEVDASRCSDLGFVEIPNVPTETDLVVRVTHQQVPAANRQYVDTYQYGVLLRSSAIVDANGMPVASPEVACAGGTACFVDETVNTIQNATYQTIARAAGVTTIEGERNLYDGMGQGHVAGEVQDCTSQHSVQHAVVSVSAPVRKLSYFDVGFGANEGKLHKPGPSSTRTMTNADGLYVGLAVNTMPGGVPIKVGAAITPSVCGADGICHCNGDTVNPAWSVADPGEAETKVLGVRTVYIFPDSITILTFDRGIFTSP